MDSQTLRTIVDNHEMLTADGGRRVPTALLAVAILALAGCGADQAATVDQSGTQGPPAASVSSPSPTTVSAPVATMAAPQTPPVAMMAAAAPAAPPASQSSPSATAPQPAMAPASADAAPPGPPAELPEQMGTPTLFWLEIGSGRVFRANGDGSNAMQIASGAPLSAPDGVAVDPVDGHVFVLNMGSIAGGANNASLVRFKLDGSSPEVLIQPGTKVGDQTFNTGKQVALDPVNRKLYMGDREGGKVWRSDLDGKNLEVLVSGHSIMQIVGVGSDPTKNQFYFSDKNAHRIYRANMTMPEGKTHADRDDVELLYVDPVASANSLDIELDVKARTVFWTDKNQNIVFGMSMDMPAGQDAMTRKDVKHVASNLPGVIGLGLDHQEGTLYSTSGGTVSSFKTDGSGIKTIGSNGSTGIAFVRIP